MNRKTMQIVIVVVCLIGAVVFAWAMGMFNSSPKHTTEADGAPVILKVPAKD